MYDVNDAARPELKAFGVLVGTWRLAGEATCEVTFAWLRGDDFLVQRATLR